VRDTAAADRSEGLTGLHRSSGRQSGARSETPSRSPAVEWRGAACAMPLAAGE